MRLAKMIKKQVRVLGIDDAPFDKFKKGNVLVVGCFFRGGDFIDGVLSSKVRVDGNDSTSKIISMVNKCKFKSQLQAVFLDGIAFGGFNVIDVNKLYRAVGIPIIVVVRRMPDLENIKKTLKKIKMHKKIRLIEKAGEPVKINDIYCQLTGISEEKAAKLLKICCTHSHIPEPIRVAHLIAAGIVKGESRGRA